MLYGASIKNVVDVRLIIGVAILTWSFVDGISQDLPCHFLDSINITDGIKHNDSSITYNDVNFNKDQYAEIDYILVKGKEHNLTKPYLRGCVCSIKPCIRSVCPIGSFYDDEAEDICKKDEAAKQVEIDIIDPNNVTNRVLLKSQFAAVEDRPCNNVFHAENYSITDNGSIMYEDKLRSHHSYMILIQKNKTTNQPMMNVLICFQSPAECFVQCIIVPYAMLVSAVFIVATMLVYIAFSDLRNLHGKCLLCYLMNLLVGYICVAFLKLNRSKSVEPMPCKTSGYLIYISFLSAFLWLSVFGFDLWKRLNKSTFNEKKRFGYYMLYAYGLPLLMTVFIFGIDQIDSIPMNLKPGIGHETCFLQKLPVPQMVYFFIPLLIISVINIIFFCLTALKRRDSTYRHSTSPDINDSYIMSLRLFIISALAWSVEGISFFIRPNGEGFALPDIFNSIHGILIFILCVIAHGRVWRIIRTRCCSRSDDDIKAHLQAANIQLLR